MTKQTIYTIAMQIRNNHREYRPYGHETMTIEEAYNEGKRHAMEILINRVKNDYR